MDDLIMPTSTSSEPGIHQAKKCTIRVLGVGGGGCNSLQHMINQSLTGVEFIAVNTDANALNRSTAPLKVQIGVKLTNGLGAGCDPNRGRKAAEESKEDIKKLLQGSELVFITAGMGGGTGTGAAPIIAEIAQEIEALTIAVVTKPFLFEGRRHTYNAAAGIAELSKHVDSIIVLDNEKLLKNLGTNISIINAFNEANDVLLNAVRGITEAINVTGYINLDFSDIKTITSGRGHAMIGSGVGQGANFVEDAVQRAIHSPLIDQVNIKCATGLLVNTRANPNFPISKWDQLCHEIQSYADEEADCKFGLIFDDQIAEDQISITILITGMSGIDVSNTDMNKRNNAAMRRSNLNNTGNLGPSSPSATKEGGFFQRTQQQQAQSGFSGNPVPQQIPAAAEQRPIQGMPHSHNVGMGQGFSAQKATQVNELNEEDPSWEYPAIYRNKV